MRSTQYHELTEGITEAQPLRLCRSHRKPQRTDAAIPLADFATTVTEARVPSLMQHRHDDETIPAIR